MTRQQAVARQGLRITTALGAAGVLAAGLVLAPPVAAAAEGAGAVASARGLPAPAPGTAEAPAAPTAVTAVAGSNRVTVRWTPPADPPGAPITGYRVQKTRDGSTWAGAGLYPAPATSVVITKLANGVRLRFRVAAVNAVGTGSWSAPTAWVTPQETPPGRVVGLTGTSPTRGRVVLRWRPPATGPAPTRYDYRYRRGFGTFVAWRPLPVTARSVSFGGLVPGADYLCQIRAVRRVDVGPTATVWVRVSG